MTNGMSVEIGARFDGSVDWVRTIDGERAGRGTSPSYEDALRQIAADVAVDARIGGPGRAASPGRQEQER